MLGHLNFQPLGLLSLAAVCKKAGHAVRLADSTKPHHVERIVSEYKPDVIGFPVITGQHLHVLKLCRQLKLRHSFNSVFGGPHATFFPDLALRPEVDAVCRGEGETALVEYLDRLQHNREPEKTPNFVTKTAGGLLENPVAPLIENLDQLPFAAWEILDEHPIAARFPVRPFMATRGCPYRCSFCYNPKIREIYRDRGHFLRRYTPERFVAEIADCRRGRKISFVYIFDDTFATDSEWLFSFCRTYQREIKLPFFVNFTANLVTADKITMLKDAGLAYVGVGLESGNEDIRRRMLCKEVTDEQLVNAAAILHRAGMAFEFYNILAIPGTSLDHDLKTLEMNVQLKPTVPDVMLYQPYPGTPLGDEAVRLGLFSGNPDDLPPTFKDRTVLAIPHATKVRRLFLLFRLLIAFGVSRKMALFLIALPLSPLYKLLSRIYEGAVKSRRIYKIRLSWKDYSTLVWNYLTSST